MAIIGLTHTQAPTLVQQKFTTIKSDLTHKAFEPETAMRQAAGGGRSRGLYRI